jgi:hypothetical protein
MENMFKIKASLLFALLILAFNPTTAILDEHSAYNGDLSGRWVDDRDQIDIKQSGNVISAEIGINGSSLSGTLNGDVITFTLIYKYTEQRGGRKSEGELKINSDGTRLTGTRSGGAFRKGSEWILTREPD